MDPKMTWLFLFQAKTYLILISFQTVNVIKHMNYLFSKFILQDKS